MIEFIKNWVMNIITLVMLIVLLEMLLPSGKTKKFIRLISGFILIIAILNPFLGLMKKGIDFKGFQIADSDFLDKKQIEQDSKLLNDSQMKTIAETYREKIISQLEDKAQEVKGAEHVKADVIIDEDYTSSNFGQIKRVYLTLEAQTQTGSTSIKPVEKVKKVEIGESSENSEVIEKSKVDAKVERQLMDKISSVFGVARENIVIQTESTQ